ncbi:hypothetical protein [Streptomyces cellostaticus]|uniref:hypothetical protein n=1 Tax=Streptomyces cellostaticus TaxID=67285 RepID=UPI001FCA1D3D|nr:hypothetical protein [Streptomyces cellostaticus]
MHRLVRPVLLGPVEQLRRRVPQLPGPLRAQAQVTQAEQVIRGGAVQYPHREAAIPVGRAVNPVSGTNGESTGVRPDVPCPAADALDRALEPAARA